MKSRNKLLIAAMCLFFAMSFATMAYAQDPADAGGASNDKSILMMIHESGPIEYLIILLSIVGISMIIENLVSVRRMKLIPTDILEEIEELFNQEDYDAAMELCEDEDCFLTRVVFSGMRKMDYGYDAIVSALEESGGEEGARLHAKIGWVSLIAQLAPMFGLLGTVTGMIASFNKMMTSANVTPQDLAGGISAALITTASGLLVAIPMIIGFFFLKNRVNSCVSEVEIISGELFDKFRPVE